MNKHANCISLYVKILGYDRSDFSSVVKRALKILLWAPLTDSGQPEVSYAGTEMTRRGRTAPLGHLLRQMLL